MAHRLNPCAHAWHLLALWASRNKQVAMAVAPKERRVELWCEDSQWAPSTCVTIHAPADDAAPILVTCGDDHVLFPDSFRDAMECAAWLVGYHRQAPATDRLAAWDAYFVPKPKPPAGPVIENNQRALPKRGPNGNHWEEA